jgi:phosphotransferase system HPr (HPr) family protein
VEISYGEKTANARSVLAVLGLGAFAGSAVLVRARGDDASTAVREIA